ncbi:MAG TPA: glycoside hydrolase family 20 zincin-like fold domain-containing protein, partial [Draconibacterium sp.]|nr:glycoside hydrolase family 20 zincin-like fold domain-containing protein [Draconibacterium sp.]
MNQLKTNTLLVLICCMFFIAGCSISEKQFLISADIDNPKIQFAVDEIKAAFAEKGIEVLIDKDKKADIVFSAENENSQLKPEGFSITKKSKRIRIEGFDDAGLMYGGLDLAEQIKLLGFEGVQETTQNPHMARRGTKFNIPLDVRTPSYTDVSDVAQKNIPEMWNFDFWKEYIDNLARYRFNLISLWSLHPFPSMVKVPGYEDVAISDVQRSTVKWKEHYDLEATGFDAPDILANHEIVKHISIDEKIEFWQKVMRYAKERNIDFYVVTWNIFVNGTDGKYGITDKTDNPVTRDYFRKSVKQMFVTYPDLAGIGLTTGENMKQASFQEKE